VSYDAVHLNAKKLCHLAELIDEDDHGAVKTPYRFNVIGAKINGY
jgi:hypothetical protein